MVNKDVHCM